MSGLGCILAVDGPPLQLGSLSPMGEALSVLGGDGLTLFHDETDTVGFVHTYRAMYEGDEPTLGSAKRSASPIVIADARIDNRRELAKELRVETSGSSNDKLICEAYKKWGLDAWDHMVGDFAIMLWDHANKRLVCARDATNGRPLFHGQYGQRFYCASSRHALFANTALKRCPNREVLAYLLSYVLPEDTDTTYESVHAVPPGGFVVVENGRVQVRRYWTPVPKRTIRYAKVDDYVMGFREHFDRAVKARAEVRGHAGVLFSGGLDSSAVVGSAESQRRRGEMNGQPLVLFRQIFPGFDCDESPYSQAVADLWNLRLESITPSSEPASFGRMLDGLPSDIVPVAMMVSTSLCALAAREANVRVLLTGNGGDEVLDWTGWSPAEHLLAGDVSPILAESGVQQHPFMLSGWRHLLAVSAGELLFPRPLAYVRAHLAYYRKVPRWLDPGWAKRVKEHRARAQQSALKHYVSSPGSADLGTYLRKMEWDIRTQMDEMFSSAGVEIRHPFLDRGVVEYLLAIAHEQRVRGPSRRHFLRLAGKEILPKRVLDRRTKPCFDSYVLACMLTSRNRYFNSSLHSSLLADWGLIDPAALRREYANLDAVSKTDKGRLAYLIAVEAWAQRAFRGN